MRDAYERAFTRDKITSFFARTGTNPIGAGDLLSVLRPVLKDATSTSVSVESLATLLEEKRRRTRRGVPLQGPVLRRGFVDAITASNVSREAAMDMMRQKEALERAKKARESLKKSTQEQKQLPLYEGKRRRRIQLELDKWAPWRA